MREALEKLGLSKNEAEVYLALLEIGQTTTGAIIKKLGIHRNIVYESLGKLEKRGLVTQTTMSGKMHFQVVSPEKILDIEKEKMTIAQNVVADLKKVQRKEKQQITVHQGIKEMKEVRNSVIKELPEGGEYMILNSVGRPFYEATKSFYKKLEEERIKKNINQRLLVSSKDYKDVIKTIDSAGYDRKLSTWKIMPGDMRSPASILTYLDKVIFQIIPPEDSQNPTVISIQNKELAESYKNYFEMVWNQEVVVYRGFEDVVNTHYQQLEKMKAGEEYCILGANWGGENKRLFDFFIDYHKVRHQKKVNLKLLFGAGMESWVDKYNNNYNKFTKIKFLPSNIYSGDVQFNLYPDNTVVIIIWRKDEPIAFEINDEGLYNGFVAYFDILWNQNSLKYQGKAGVEKVIDEVIKSKKDFSLMGANGLLIDRYPDLFEKMEEGRLKNNTKRINLAVEKVRNKEFVKGLGVKTKFLPNDFESPTITWLFDNKFVNIVWTKPEVVTIVEDQRIVDGFMKRFNYLWSIAKD